MTASSIRQRRPAMLCTIRTLLVLGLVVSAAQAQDPRQAALASLDANYQRYTQVAKQIWDWAEVGYQETRSSALLQEQLRAAGFQIEAGVAGMATAFRGRHGKGKPGI